MSEHTRSPNDKRDDIAVLLRVAGKRRAVPEERFDRVHDAARNEWRRTVARRGSRRRHWLAASVATAALLAVVFSARFVFLGPQRPLESAVHVASIVGPVWIDDGTGRRELIAGEAIAFGTQIGTTADGRLALALASGHAVRLDRETRLRLLGSGLMALDQGGMYVDSGVDSVRGTLAAHGVEIHTPLGIVREIGTQYEVRVASGTVRVRLREGAVVVDHDDRKFEVVAGGELMLSSNGSVTRNTIPGRGPEWEWWLDVTTTPVLAGRTARSFLDWVARERGWTLAFADEEIARSVETIVLGGTADGLTIDEALDAVLPTCRLTYRIDDGTLLIDVDRE